MDPLDQFFKFRIGQKVTHRLDAEGRPEPMLVVLRELNQCVGGVQPMYICRTKSTWHVSDTVLRLHELELLPFEEVPDA